jgi:hypothetical protein
MKQVSQNVEAQAPKSPIRRGYSTPQLKVYGAVREFTQGSLNRGTDADGTKNVMNP